MPDAIYTPFPVTMERTRENVQQLFGEVAEEKHVADIFAAVNEKFQAEEHPEFMIKDVEKIIRKRRCYSLNMKKL